MNTETIDTYNREADVLAKQYESKSFEDIHSLAIPFIPDSPSRILDIGSGSGRDAAYFAKQGHNVVAVEPAKSLRNHSSLLHPSTSITWIDDSLPGLKTLLDTNEKFDLIWLSAIWMHVDPLDREVALRNISRLLFPTGKVMISLRHGTPPLNRKVHPVSVSELDNIGQKNNLKVILSTNTDDRFNRDNVWWETVVMEYTGNE